MSKERTRPKIEKILGALNSGETISKADIDFLSDKKAIVDEMDFSQSLTDEGRATLQSSVDPEDVSSHVILSEMGLVDTDVKIGEFTPGIGSGGMSTAAKFGGAIFGAAGVSALGNVYYGRNPWDFGSGSTDAISGGREGNRSAPRPQGVDPAAQELVVFDPSTGEQVPLSALGGSNPSSPVGQYSGVPSYSSDTISFVNSLGIDMSAIQASSYSTVPALSSVNELGEGKVAATYQFGIGPTGTPFGSVEEFGRARRPGPNPTDVAAEDYARYPTLELQMGPGGEGQATRGSRGGRTLVGNEAVTGPSEGDLSQAAAPVGARLSQRAIQDDGTGMSNLGRASKAARATSVPLDLLYGTITATSGWNQDAVGNAGNDYGLAQLNKDEVPIERATDPDHALMVAGLKLRRLFQQYGSWEMAVLGYRDPAAVDRFISTGTMSKEDKSFLTNALAASQDSGLGNNVFDFGSLAAVPTSRGSGSGRQGPVIPPFVEPDKATLREYTRAAFAEVLGREARDKELDSGVEKLMQGFREAYEQEVRKIQGAESVNVDPQARFMEDLKGSGEASYVTESRQQRSISDMVGDFARIVKEL